MAVASPCSLSPEILNFSCDRCAFLKISIRPDHCHIKSAIIYGPSFLHFRKFSGSFDIVRRTSRTSVRTIAGFDLQLQNDFWLAEIRETILTSLQNGVSSVASAVSVSPTSNSIDNHPDNLEGILSRLLTVPLTSVYISVAALSITAGVAAYLAASLSQTNDRHAILGDRTITEQAKDCLLIMNPTPFNRYVLMRCPSIAFEEVDVYEWLMKTAGRSSFGTGDGNRAGTLLRVAPGNDVTSRLSPGRGGQQKAWANLPNYQRTFLYAEDGGVLAMDWPSHLELSGAHGLDTTFLLIPGSADGSGDKRVQNFVQRSLNCGCFPIVLNPRGCAGSPVTTPRLYTAGDSDDVHLAIDFITRSRPEVIIMSVGWGYGANMLLKYLGEEKAATPLTAAVCIGNTFDLEESTKLFQHGQGQSSNQEMIKDFVQILESNQMVFEGRKKGFDVQKGLSAKSIREFDAVISRVAHGFDTLEAFYDNASSRSWIDRVEIPLLCIQNDDTAPRILSIPSHVFEGNSFITLITLRSRSWDLKNGPSFQTAARGCFDNLIIEWLAAVELAFLKGHHPLLEGLDQNFKSPEEWSTFDKHCPSPQSVERKKINSFMGLRNGKNLDQNRPYTKQHYHEFLGSNGATHQQSSNNNGKNMGGPPKLMSSIEKGKALERIPIVEVSGDPIVGDLEADKAPPEAENMEETPQVGEGEAEMERIDVRQAAETVMNIFDITMPGTLSDKQKQKVLDGVEKGETIITALQEACPEEVREKMATAVSAAVQASGISLKLVGFGENMPAPKIPTGMKEIIQEKLSLMVKSKFYDPNMTRTDEAKRCDSSSESKNAQVGNVNSLNKSTEAEHQIGVADGKKVETSEQKAATVSQDDLAVAEKPLGLNSEIPDGLASQAQNKEMQAEKTTENRILENQKESGAAKQNSDALSPDNKVREKSTENRSLENQRESGSAKQDSDAVSTDNKVREEEITENRSLDNQKESGAAKQDSDIMSTDSKVRKEESTENRSLENQKENGAAKQDSDTMSTENKVREEGRSVEVVNENNDLSNQDLKSDKHQENYVFVPQSGEAAPELSGTEKKSDVLTNSVSGQEDPKTTAQRTDTEVASSSQMSMQSSVPFQSIDMRQAFEALTGVDDSTQIAVTNVFGVIENVLEQLEKEHNQKEQHLTQPPDHEDYQASITEKSGIQLESEKHIDESLKDTCVHSVNEDDCSGLCCGHNCGTTNDAEIVVSPEDKAFHGGKKIVNSTGLVSRLNGPIITGTSTDVLNKQLAQSSPHGNKEQCRNIGRLKCENMNLDQTRVSKNQNIFTNVPSQCSALKRDQASKITDEDDDEDVAMEYFEEENIWKCISNTLDPMVLLKRKNNFDGTGDAVQQERGESEVFHADEPRKSSEKNMYEPVTLPSNETPQVIEPSYIILDDDLKVPKFQNIGDDIQNDQHEDAKTEKDTHKLVEGESECCLRNIIRELIIDALKLELVQRLGYSDMETLGVDLDKEISRVANAVAEASILIMPGNDHGVKDTKSYRVTLNDMNSQESGKMVLHAETVVHTVNSVYSDTSILAGILPAYVLVGVILASLRPLKFIVLDDMQKHPSTKSMKRKEVYNGEDLSPYKTHQSGQKCDLRSNTTSPGNSMEVKLDRDDGLEKIGNLMKCDNNVKDSFEVQEGSPENTSPVHKPMMDTVAAAMGATAAFASEGPGITSSSSDEQGSDQRVNYGIEPNFLHEIDDGNEGNDNKTNIVSSFAEKAMSVAAPVVPTTQDGGVDHDRLVAILAGLGQKGGVLRYIGKVALLWGGLRGAMSLTDRLLVFLHISDRPLYQRLLGFIAMALLLWAPVVVPLLPTLLQQWDSKSVGGVAKTAAVTGLYGAIVILVTIWGRKIRGYESPLSQYGLKIFPCLKVRQLQSLTSGLAVGFSIVASFYVIGISLGVIDFSWATIQYLVTSKTIILNALSCWRIIKLVVSSLVMGVATSLIKELLFRSWLHEEIAVDLGFHKAAVLSGLVFSVSHWSLPAIPGLWLLAFVLAGARVRCSGDLELAIGIHAGIIAGNRIINTGGLVKYATNAPDWVTGAQAGNLLGGLLGISIVGIIALFFYPWNHVWRPKNLNFADGPQGHHDL